MLLIVLCIISALVLLMLNFTKFITSFVQRFIQHFDLLQKACIPDHAPYPSFNESTTHARLSVSNLRA